MTEISKREHFAVLILAGILANPESIIDYSDPENPNFPELAIDYADELIRQLDALEVAENYNAHAPEAE